MPQKTLGPREAQLRAMREAKVTTPRKTSKTSKSAKLPSGKKASGRGR
jgi:hypothetical protein